MVTHMNLFSVEYKKLLYIQCKTCGHYNNPYFKVPKWSTIDNNKWNKQCEDGPRHQFPYAPV